MIAIAEGGRPEDNAKMVCWRGCIAYLASPRSSRNENAARLMPATKKSTRTPIHQHHQVFSRGDGGI
ncbi:MAG TPA: hypothetical protein VGC77_15465 [Rhodopseudomonas sp.]|uniref:hypothetical protein n=1 Tax=Rhodopseudomonas sp. TaxID=1078 RepID=UPI002ED92D09